MPFSVPGVLMTCTTKKVEVQTAKVEVQTMEGNEYVQMVHISLEVDVL